MAEHFPQSSAPSTATTTVKVSLDEWAIVDRRAAANAELMTDGLSGCVAVAIRTGDKLALTHVYSGALDRFDDYRKPLAEFVAKVGSKAEITDVHIMDNGNAVTPKHGMTLSDMIQRHLVDGGLVHADAVHRHRDNGCTLAEGGFYAKARDNAAIYLGGYTNTALDGMPEARAKHLHEALGSGGFAVSREYRGPSEVDAPVRTDTSAAHDERAKYVPRASVAASSQDASAPRAVSPHEALVPDIAGPLGASKLFGLNRMPVSVEIARQAHAAGVERVENVKVGDGGKLVSVIGSGLELEFAVSGRTVTLQPSLSVQAVPHSDLPASSSAPPLSSPQPSVASSSVPPSTPYAQALAALEPHREALKLRDPGHASEAAREIASLAHRDGLTAITRLDLVGQDRGTPALVAHQEGPSAKQSQPMPVETLQRHAGVVVPAQAQSQSPSGPDKSHCPIM
jgi:hypothetical protein